MFTVVRELRYGPDEWAAGLGHGAKDPLRPRAVRRFSAAVRHGLIWPELGKHLRPGDTLLDVGSGMGEWVRFFIDQGIRARGLDYSEKMVEWCRLRMPSTEWHHSSMTRIPLPNDSLDHVVSWGVIEHDPDGPQRALAEFFRVLKPGGHLFVTVPLDTPHQRRLAVLEDDQENPRATFYSYLFTGEELGQMAHEAGFEVLATVPASRHYALVFPRLCLAARRVTGRADAILSRLLAPWVRKRPGAQNMVLAVGVKPRADGPNFPEKEPRVG
jgi:SAM-dependent methyltransferase